MKYKILGYEDLEDLNYLAEDVLHELRFHHYLYSEDGDYIQYTVDQRLELSDKLIKQVKLSQYTLEFRNNEELKKISFEQAVHMTYEEIKVKYLKGFLSKARGMMRKGSYIVTPLKVSDEVSDQYLDDLIALRYKENLKLWTMKYEIDNK